jgi:hypothetical protein
MVIIGLSLLFLSVKTFTDSMRDDFTVYGFRLAISILSARWNPQELPLKILVPEDTPQNN